MLLADTLRLERPEFDGQLRSIERDVGLHKQQIDHAKVLLMAADCFQPSTFRKISINLKTKVHLEKPGGFLVQVQRSDWP